jgi:glycosyltransferase involved in cell wall biosynthesis
MPSLLPISICIVAKNEAENLTQLLPSVTGWVSEIIVVLNNTNDDSEKIARSFGAKVFHLPWQGYRDTKNAALALCSQDWILTLDADEEVSSALKSDIINFLNGNRSTRFVGARFPRKVWFINRWITHGDWYPDLSLRLFRRDAAKWGGDAHVHEKIEITGPVTTLKGDLHHYTMPSLYQYINKIPHFTDLALEQHKENCRSFSIPSTLFRSFWRFFRAYVLRRGFLDGYPGFIIAVFTAFSTFVRYTRLYEHLNVRTEPKVTGVTH